MNDAEGVGESTARRTARKLGGRTCHLYLAEGITDELTTVLEVVPIRVGQHDDPDVVPRGARHL